MGDLYNQDQQLHSLKENMKLKKTRHFRLDEGLEKKLLQICSATKKKPSEIIRNLIQKEKTWELIERSS